jgi:hypothetical protein
MASRSRCACGKVKSKEVSKCRKCFEALVQSNRERIRRINEVLDAKDCILDTAFGEYRVLRIDHNFVATCGPKANPKDWFGQRTFHLHAGRLPELEQQLGLNP